MNLHDLALDGFVLLAINPNFDGEPCLDLSNFIAWDRDLDSHRFYGTNLEEYLTSFDGCRLSSFKRSAQNDSVDRAFDLQMFLFVQQDFFFGDQAFVF